MRFSKHGHQLCEENEIFPYIKHEVYCANFGDDPAVIFYIQLFQLTLSDQSFKPTRRDRMVVWVEVKAAARAEY